MKARDCFNKVNSTKLISSSLKYCYMDEEKHPYFNIGELADPSNPSGFKSLRDLDDKCLDYFAGIGISIQASKVSAIDVDHCFSEANQLDSINELGKNILEHFKDFYVEYSFSGTGMRILFTADVVLNYKEIYYIKNSKTHCEYYYPEGSNRYVSITGRTIYDNPIKKADKSILIWYLETYMKRPPKPKIEPNFQRLEGSIEVLLQHFLWNDTSFQQNWFEKAPGSNSNESERDFYLISFIFKNITCEKEQVKKVFESSPFFKSKDYKHRKKWEYDNFRYFNYIFNQLGGK